MTNAAARAGTARVTVAALGLVLGVSGAVALPLLFPWQGAASLAAVAAALALLPFAGLAVAWRRAPPPAPAPRLWWLASAVVAVSSLALVPLWNAYHAQLRVLNLGEEPLSLWVDGRRLARVEPSSGESASAGVELTLPAGSRELRVVSEPDARELSRARYALRGGSPHLFVPARGDYCFFIERRAYGDGGEVLESEPLEGDSGFWVLPDGISWFVPNPEPGPLETSGGTLSCLRQKRCGP